MRVFVNMCDGDPFSSTTFISIRRHSSCCWCICVYVYMYVCMYVRYLVVLSAALSQSFVYRVVLAGKNHRYVLMYYNVLQFQPIFASCVSRRHFSCVGLVFVAIFSCFGVSFVRSYLPMVRSRD